MAQTELNLTTLCGDLAQAAGQLQSYCIDLDDNLTAAALEGIRRKLGQGLVRVALVGKTSSGKSALVNALVSALIVPENPNTSSPIPVWICHQNEDGVSITIHEQAGEGVESTIRQCSLEEFLTRYCYSISDVNDQKRERFLNVDYATVGLRSHALEQGVVFVDTLGIAATTVDSAKTIAVLDDEIDLVVYVTREPQMKTDEVLFLQKYVLGCHEDVTAASYVPPENLLFVYNNFNPREPHNKVAFAKSVEDVLAPLHLPAQRLESLLNTQLFYINALMARLARCGAYPYARYAPDRSTEAEKAALARREQRDSQLAQRMDPAKLLAASGIESLLDGIAGKADQLTSGTNSVAGKRIGTLVEMANGVKLAANRRMEAANLTTDALEKQRQNLQEFSQDSEEKRRLVRHSMQMLERSYRESFVRLFRSREELMNKECRKRVFQLPCPDSFINYADFRKMEDEAKAEYLLPYLREIVAHSVASIKEQVKQALDVREANIGDMPFKVLNKARDQITNEMNAFNARIRKLGEDGLEELGVHLPETQAVEALFSTFKVDLERQVMSAIEQAMTEGGRAYMEKLEDTVHKVRSNLIVNIFPQLLRRENFWDLMLEKAAGPMVKLLQESLIELMGNTSVDGIGRATQKAFENAADEINTSYVRLRFSLESGVSALEKLLEHQEPLNEEMTQKIAMIKTECDAMVQKLLSWQQSLATEVK